MLIVSAVMFDLRPLELETSKVLDYSLLIKDGWSSVVVMETDQGLQTFPIPFSLPPPPFYDGRMDGRKDGRMDEEGGSGAVLETLSSSGDPQLFCCYLQTTTLA